MINLTKRQKEIYDFYWNKDNWKLVPPTFVDVKNKFGFKSNQTVSDHISLIKKKGYYIPKRISKPNQPNKYN
jgi:SOS-response transcriptional repressor LexA